MSRSRRCRRIECRVARAPQFFARPGVKRGHHLGSVAPGKDVDGVGDDEGRSVALSDVDLPPACQRIGPRCRLREGAGGAVAVQPAPLGIVSRRALCCGRAGTPDQHGNAHPPQDRHQCRPTPMRKDEFQSGLRSRRASAVGWHHDEIGRLVSVESHGPQVPVVACVVQVDRTARLINVQ